MPRQYFHQLESASASHLGQKVYKLDIDAMTLEERYMLPGSGLSAIRLPKVTVRFYAKWMAQIMMYVTAIHEQVGAVEASRQPMQSREEAFSSGAAKVYAQDVSWTAFRWPKGKMCGTKQTATASALLMSFTNMPMPKLLGPCFMRRACRKARGAMGFATLLRLMGQDWSHIFPTPATGSPKEVFRKFQAGGRKRKTPSSKGRAAVLLGVLR